MPINTDLNARVFLCKKFFHSAKLWCTMTMRNCLFLLTWKCSRFATLKAKTGMFSLIGKEKKSVQAWGKLFFMLVPKTFIFFCFPLFLLALTNHDCKKILERKRISGILFCMLLYLLFQFFMLFVFPHICIVNKEMEKIQKDGASWRDSGNWHIF